MHLVEVVCSIKGIFTSSATVKEE